MLLEQCPRKYRSLAKAQKTWWWPFQLNPSAEAVQPVLPRKQVLHLELLALRRALLQQPVPKAPQDPAEEPCLGHQGCQNTETGGVSHPGLVKMLSLSGDQEEQQHWRALIHHLFLPAERWSLTASWSWSPQGFVNWSVSPRHLMMPLCKRKVIWQFLSFVTEDSINQATCNIKLLLSNGTKLTVCASISETFSSYPKANKETPSSTWYLDRDGCNCC